MIRHALAALFLGVAAVSFSMPSAKASEVIVRGPRVVRHYRPYRYYYPYSTGYYYSPYYYTYPTYSYPYYYYYPSYYYPGINFYYRGGRHRRGGVGFGVHF